MSTLRVNDMSNTKLNIAMEKLVGCRFGSLETLKNKIEKITNKKVGNLLFSESENVEGCDNMIDYYFEGEDDVRTLFFLWDNGKKIYVTET